jgi:hypothetical protein
VISKEDEDMPGTIGRMADGVYGEAPAIQRMSRIDHLDLSRVG